MSNLRYDMKETCLLHSYEDRQGKQITDHDTEKAYRRNIDRFCVWLKDTYHINTVKQLNNSGGAKKYIQAYANFLSDSGRSANTIHTYLSPVCKGLGIHLNEINKPIRSAIDLKKSRNKDANKQGKRETVNKRFERVITAQKMFGLRRSELKKLRIRNLCKDESGYLCVEVENGKGGKRQLQRLLPEDITATKEFFKTVWSSAKLSEPPISDTLLFSSAEFDNKIDLHGMRAEQARRAYEHYLKRCETPLGRANLQTELVLRWNACHHENEKINTTKDGYTANSKKGQKYIRELTKVDKYLLRGANKTRALKAGRPILYDRTALLATSVFHLSHWRTNVTVINYML